MVFCIAYMLMCIKYGKMRPSMGGATIKSGGRGTNTLHFWKDGLIVCLLPVSPSVSTCMSKTLENFEDTRNFELSGQTSSRCVVRTCESKTNFTRFSEQLRPMKKSWSWYVCHLSLARQKARFSGPAEAYQPTDIRECFRATPQMPKSGGTKKFLLSSFAGYTPSPLSKSWSRPCFQAIK